MSLSKTLTDKENQVALEARAEVDLQLCTCMYIACMYHVPVSAYSYIYTDTNK